ncbi:hypothetical protein M7I_6688 [Glarea lozoyensis 74030]|uniref:Uncharacterized protein n=1 Tax=Glarea lozoyensis (strain ATCC 74030 / MF5533) TaxID=1104152 RepID=H0EV93_GLAL7|nr:hypothetical protein M7I_6688 [Glarea lozoyensis 74030]
MDWVEALFSRLGFENADGRLSGQEHRGRFPHTLFLQPQATVSEENPNDQKETMLFMPYLHFETNQGRIGLSNALSRMARSLTEKNMGDNPLSLSPQNDAASTVEDFAENDPSDDDSDDDLIKGPTEKKFEQYKEKFKQFRRLIKHYQKTTLDSVSQTYGYGSSEKADRHSRIFAKLGVGWDDEDDFVETKAISLSNKSKKDKRKEKYKAKKRKMMKKAQLYINEEVELLVEIQDIRDELRIIEMVLEDQYTVLADVENETQQPKSLTHISRAKFPPVDGKPVDSHVKFNRRSIEHMVLGARDVYNAIYHLIDLKQKQANITEARYARREANSAAKEGRLPLSFMTSFFSLDIVEFPKDPVTQEKDLPLRWVAKYISIALPSIALAMAIGPMAGFAKKLGRAVRYWAANILGVIGGLIVLVLLTAIAIALIPVAVGLLSSSSRRPLIWRMRREMKDLRSE